MRKIEEIEKEVQGLTPDAPRDFQKWFRAFDAQKWDIQFEKYALSGKLDSLAAVAHKAFKLDTDRNLNHFASPEYWGLDKLFLQTCKLAYKGGLSNVLDCAGSSDNCWLDYLLKT